MNILEIKDLKKSYRDLDVIKGLNFAVPAGSIFGFVGINGSGKTTTMKMALGLLSIDEGEITICGERAEYGKTIKDVGYLPDVPEYYPYMKPMEYLTLCGEIAGMSKERINKRGKELLDLVGLKSKRKIGGFSRGMKQRLGIAQALLNEPKLLICDEPTSALDPMGRKEILDILTAVKGQTTVIFSTHILSDVERICDRVVFLHDGIAVLDGLVSDIKKQKTDSYLIEFAENEKAKQCALIFTEAELSQNTVVIKKADGQNIIKAMAENGLVPVKFELLEPTLEDLFIGAIM
ncbi:MAG: ABC transporter ATP-binding protein [Lachnospiraceae bacterium]|nr:ABC transporter ATP-binding protein [Lachnospiraceae bacterium]